MGDYSFQSKYPRFRITGDQVSPVQAAEILARTSINCNQLNNDYARRVVDPLEVSILSNHIFSTGANWITIDGEFHGQIIPSSEKWPDWTDLIAEVENIAETFDSIQFVIQVFEEDQSDREVYHPGDAVAMIYASYGEVLVEVLPRAQGAIYQLAPYSRRGTAEKALELLGW